MNHCKRITKTNKNESKLFNRLYLLANENENLADKYYSYFYSSDFLDDFGNFVEDYNNDPSIRKISQKKIDDNGEPILFLDKKNNKYYYLNKNNKKSYFPKKENKLRSIFTNEDISSIANVLTRHYINNNSKNIINNFENFEISGKIKESLKQSIFNKLNAKSQEFLKSEDFHQQIVGDYLQESLQYLDEWVNEVNFKLRNLKLKYNEEFEEELLNEEEFSERGQVFNKASFESSYKNSINSEIKLMLSFLQDKNKLDSLFNEPIFLSFDEVYGTLLNLLNTVSVKEGEDIYEKYVQIISENVKYKPYLSTVLKLLNSANENVKSAFIQSFRLNKINLLTSTIEFSEKESEGKTFKHTTQNISAVGSNPKLILEEWSVLFNEKQDSDTKLKLLLEKVNNLSLTYDKNNVENFNNSEKILKELLNDFGINVEDNVLNYYLSNNSAKELSIKDKFNKGRKLISAMKYFLNNFKKENNTKTSVLSEEIEFNRLSQAESFFKEDSFEASVSSVNGKQRWTFSKPSYLSNKINLWKENPDLLYQYYLSTPRTESSYYLEFLLALDHSDENREKISKERLSELEIAVFNSLQEEGDSDSAVDGKTLSINDQYADFVNKLLSPVKNAKSWISTPTPADKNTQYEISYGNTFLSSKIKYKVEQNKIVLQGLNSKIENIIFNYFKGEYERMKIVSKEIEEAKKSKDSSNLRVHYHLGNKNGLKSQLFPSLSPSFNKDGSVSLPNLGNLQLYDSTTGYPASIDGEYLNLDNFKDQILKLMLPIINENITKTYYKLQNLNMFSLDEDANFINNAVDSEIFKKYVENYSKAAGLYIAADVFLNGFISQVEYSLLFSGDPAYYKNMVDYKKRIPATYTDGLQLRLNKDSIMFNVSVIDSVEISIPDLDNFEKLAGKEISDFYKEVNAADAQGWITPQRWKFLIENLGKWTKDHDALYKKFFKQNPKYTEKELKLLAQPLKGVYFDINSNVPVYLKYSQAVLLPNLIKNTDLQKLYNKMVLDEKGKEKPFNEQIHEIITIDGVKAGSIKPEKIHNEKGKIVDDFTLTKLQLKNSGWKLQQDLPVKGMKETMIGSQIQKNIFQGLAFNLEKKFTLNNELISGQDLLNHINDLVGELSNIGMESLIEELDIDDNGKINNLERFYSALSDELKERDGSRNILDALEAQMTPYAIPQAHSKLNNIFASIVNKKLIKIKTNGGSFIQMSNFGLSYNDIVNSNTILLTDSLNTYEPKHIEDNKIKPAGIFISGSFISKYIPEYKEFISEYGIEAFKEIIDPKILQNIIGYRIPNQGLSSNDALEIIGILPDEVGDTIVAYTGITKKTGSDFDIDKMYLMVPSFKYEEGMLKYIEYDNSLSYNLQTKEALQNRLIETYKSVLTHPDVIKEVVTPLDFEYIKDLILELYPEKNSSDMEDFNSFDDIILKYQFKAGKAGVGQEANALVDHVRGTMANMSLNKTYLGIGHKNESDETFFDKEFSASLSEKDMKENNIPENLKKIKISNTLSAILNAFVDIAKDPYITRANWTTLTTNTGNMMLRAGVHPFYVISFLGQPIIKDYVSFSNNRESKINKDTGKIKDKFLLNLVSEKLDSGKNNYIEINGKTKTFSSIYKILVKQAPKSRHISEVEENSLKNLTPEKVANLLNIKLDETNDFRIDNVISKIKSVHSEIFYTKIKPFESFSLKELKDQIKNPKIKDPQIQLSVLSAFFDYQEKSKILRDSVLASKQDVSGMGQNFTSLLSTYNLIEQLKLNELNNIEGSLKGFSTKLEKDNKLTLLGHYTNNVIFKMKKIMEANPNLFFIANDNVINTFNEISKDIKGSLLTDQELGKILEKEYYSYLLSDFEPFNFSKEEKRYLINDFPKELKLFTEKHKGDFKILDNLKLKNGENNKYFLGVSNRKKSSAFETELTDSWSDLIESFPEIGEKLIKYSYLTSGFKLNKNQFFTLIPYQWFLKNNIEDYLLEKSKNLPEIDNIFIQQLYKNNVKNSKIVPNYFENNVLKLKDFYPTVTELNSKFFNTGFKLNKEGKARFYIKKQVENETFLFELKGYDKNHLPVYIRVNTLGFSDKKGNSMTEYSFNKRIGPAINPLIKIVPSFAEELMKDIVYPQNYFSDYKNENNIVDNEQLPDISLELDENSEIPRFLIKKQNKEIGFINYSEDSNGMNVDEIVMYSKYRNLGYGKIALSNFENLTNSNIVRGSQESNLGEKLMNSFQNKDYIEQWKIHGTELQKIDSSLTLEKFIELPDEEKNKLIECYGKK